MDQVQEEIAQLKALINEQNKRQDVLLQFIKKTNSNIEDVFKYLKSRVSTIRSTIACIVNVMFII